MVRASRIKAGLVKLSIAYVVLFVSEWLICLGVFFCFLVDCLSIAGGRFIRTGWFHGRICTFGRHSSSGAARRRCFRRRIISVIPHGARKVALQVLFGHELNRSIDNFFRLFGSRWIFATLRSRCCRRRVAFFSFDQSAGLAKRSGALVFITATKKITSISFLATDLLC